MSEENQLLNALVSDYLSKVSPGIAKKFKSIHSPSTVPISLNEVVEHFSKTAPPKRKLSLGINDGPGAKKAKESGTEDSESDSSSDDSSDSEAEDNKKVAAVPAKKTVPAAVSKPASNSKDSSSSSEDSDDESSDAEEAKPTKKKTPVKPPVKKTPAIPTKKRFFV